LPAQPVEYVYPDSGFEQGIEKSETSVETNMDPFGHFIEASLPDTGNFPLGILRDPFSAAGNYYVAVQLGGINAGGPDHRLTRVEFPVGQSTAGLLTGGGTMDATAVAPLAVDPDLEAWASDGGKSNFGFVVYKKWATGPVQGQFNYLNKVTGEHIKSVMINTFEIIGNTAKFSGTCKNKGQLGVEVLCTFDVTVQDNGNPGKDKDTFQISGFGVTPNAGTLNGGNIKIHKGR
jgi:hypothetical protein